MVSIEIFFCFLE